MRLEESGFPQWRLIFGSSVIPLGSVCLETYIREGWASAVIMASIFSLFSSMTFGLRSQVHRFGSKRKTFRETPFHSGIRSVHSSDRCPGGISGEGTFDATSGRGVTPAFFGL